MIHILVVEDDPAISGLIELNLVSEGYGCTCAFDGMEAADLLEEHDYDLILLDVMLPKLSGFELFEYIRTLSIPVIFLTAVSDVENRVKGLSLGAEDYIVKPFEIIELLARIQVVLRRFHKTETRLSIGDVVLDTEEAAVFRKGTRIHLTAKEYELLLFLMQNRNLTLFREKIYETIWGTPQEDTRTLDLHIQRLRKKLSLGPYLKTVYGIGYRLEEN